MSRSTSIMSVVLLGVVLLASAAFSQQSTKGTASDPGAAPSNAMSASRGARHLLRNGSDYLSYQEYERALEFFREAEARQSDLTPAERQTLKQGIERAKLGMREAADAPRKAYAKSQVNSRPGAIATAQPAPAPGSNRFSDEPVQRAGAMVAEAAPDETQAQPFPRSSSSGGRSTPNQTGFPGVPLGPPVVVMPASQTGPVEPAPSQPAVAGAEVSPAPALPSGLPVGLSNPPPPLGSLTAPEALPSAASVVAVPAAEGSTLPSLPGEMARPSAPPEPLVAPSGRLNEPLIPSLLPGEAAPGSSAVEPLPPAAESGRNEDIQALPGEANVPGTTAATSARPVSRVATRMGSGRLNLAQAGPYNSTLPAELRREVEHIARLQDEVAQRNQATEAEQPTTQLELPRAPSPTEARPIRAIPVPEEFVPLAPRQWAPNRKYWAAAATCHAPLYFQDAALERYGHSVEQFFGPAGRFLTYPIDDPTQSNQRNQIAQPFLSAGLLVAQIITLPYNLIVDPPWEAEYDLGYWRPGDRIPNDIYYMPLRGVGPPLRGMNY